MVLGIRRNGDDEQVALSDARISLTRPDLDRTLSRAANAIIALDLPTGATIAVFANNAVEVTIAHLAALYAGVSSVPVNSMLHTDEVAHILRDSSARAVFVGPETAAVGLEAAGTTEAEVVIGWRCPDVAGVTGWEAWVAAASDDEPDTDLPATSLMFYTSGTTGLPKGTLTRRTEGLHDVSDTVAWWRNRLEGELGRGHTPCLVIGPMHHHGPLTSSIEGVFGGGTHILDHFRAETVLATVERLRAGSFVAVPTHLARMLALPAEVRARYDLSSLHFVGLTGSSCPVEVKRSIIEWWGHVVWEAYGGTESGVVCFIDSTTWLQHPGSVGRCVPDFEPIVLDDADRPCGSNQPGRLYFRDRTGRGIEYRNAPEKTREAHLEPGVFTLGDIGYVDDDGFVYVTDRAVDMIVSGGVNVYPAEIEGVLLRHPCVRDVAVIGVPHHDLGETPLALVEVADAAVPPDPAELVAFCRDRLAHYKCPRTVQFVESVGRTSMGKLDKRSLRAPYWPTDRSISG